MQDTTETCHYVGRSIVTRNICSCRELHTLTKSVDQRVFS